MSLKPKVALVPGVSAQSRRPPVVDAQQSAEVGDTVPERPNSRPASTTRRSTRLATQIFGRSGSTRTGEVSFSNRLRATSTFFFTSLTMTMPTTGQRAES